MKKFFLLAFLVGLLAGTIEARQRAQGYCSQGGVTLQVSGLAGSPLMQGSYPGCTVEIFLSGTLTHPTNIYADNSGTIKANPFTADLQTGLWFFYADNGRYDVKLSGGGIPTPFTLGDVLLNEGAGQSNTVIASNINNQIYIDGSTYPISCAGVQAALNAAAIIGTVGGSTVWLPAQDITCTVQLIIPVFPGQIILRGAGTVSRIINNVGTDALFLAKGTLGASTTTTAPFVAGALTLTVANGAVFSGGQQWVEISDTTWPCGNVPPAGAGGQCNSELVLINSVSSNTVSLANSIDNSYTTGATVQVVNPAIVQFRDFSIVNFGMSFPAIKEWYCINCIVNNLFIQGGLWVNATTPAIQIAAYHSKHGSIENSFLGNMDGILQGGTQSAPILIAGASSYYRINNNTVHKYVENALVESVHHITVAGNSFEGFVDDAFNTHGDGSYAVSFSGNTLSGNGTNSAGGNLGFAVAGETGFRSGFPDRDISITGNTFTNFGSACVYVNGQTPPGAQVANITITGNVCANQNPVSSGYGIDVQFCQNCTISNNIVQNVATNNIAYYINQSNNSTISGNIGSQINSAAGTTGLLCVTCNRGSIYGNTMSGQTSAGFNITTSSQNLMVFGNTSAVNSGTNYIFDSSDIGLQRWMNQGDSWSVSANGDSPHRATFSGLLPATNTAAYTFASTPFDKTIKVTRLTALSAGAGTPSCTTYPVIQVTDGTTLSPALTLSSSTYQDSGAISVIYPTTSIVSLRMTNTPSCTTYPASVNVTMQYEIVGN